MSDKFKTEIEIPLTPEQLAEMFIHWGDKEQANFINLVGLSFKKADFSSEMQCCCMADHINKLGKDFIYTMANFIKVQKFEGHEPHFDMLINSYPGDSLD